MNNSNILSVVTLTFNNYHELIKTINSLKGIDSVDVLNKEKLKLVNDVLLYYNFLYKDKEYTKAEDPSQWIVQEFKIWKSEGYHMSTVAYNASQTANSANATLNTTAAAATIK